MSKSLNYWIDVFAQESETLVKALREGGPRLEKIDKQAVKKTFYDLISSLKLGWAITVDTFLLTTSVVSPSTSAAPAPAPPLPGTIFVPTAAQVGAEVLKIISEDKDDRWWKDKNRYKTFASHVRRILGMEKVKSIDVLMAELCRRLKIRMPALIKGWDKTKESHKTFAAAVCLMIGGSKEWVGTEEHGNLSYLLAGLEHALIKTRAASSADPLPFKSALPTEVADVGTRQRKKKA